MKKEQSKIKLVDFIDMIKFSIDNNIKCDVFFLENIEGIILTKKTLKKFFGKKKEAEDLMIRNTLELYDCAVINPQDLIMIYDTAILQDMIFNIMEELKLGDSVLEECYKEVAYLKVDSYSDDDLKIIIDMISFKYDYPASKLNQLLKKTVEEGKNQ